jgi:hypothetical protein
MCAGIRAGFAYGGRRAVSTESKQFFFVKKNQKTFEHLTRALRQRAHPKSKSFCFFFQKEVLS